MPIAKIRKVQCWTQAALAARAGVTRSTVSSAIRRGNLRAVPTLDGTPLVLSREAERWMRARAARK